MKNFTLKNALNLLIVAFLLFGCSIDNSDKGPGKEITLRLEPKEGNPRNSEGDFIQLNDGRILFIYTHFTGGTGDHASAYLAGRYSDDKGKTWTKEDILILPNEGGMNIMSVSLLRLDNGKIALFYLRKNSETDCIPFMRISSDEAKSWSEPIRCIDTEGYHVVNNDRFIQLPGGRILFPTSLHAAPTWANGKIICYYSDDSGTTWNRSQQIANFDNTVLQEPGIVELENGKMMLFCRTDSGVQYFSFSEDQGETWSPIKPGNIKSPLSPASIERIPDTGDLLLLWNHNYEKGRDGGKRTPFNLAISKDEGKTWEKIKTVESDPAGWYCYTAIEFVGNHVLLGHCAGDTRTNNGLSTTQVTRLSLDWIYKDTTPDPIVESESEGVVKFTCKDKDVQIRYTLDGTLPTQETGLLYQNPITVSRITPLYMQSFEKGKTPSKIVFTQIGTNVYQPAQELSFVPEVGLIYHYYKGEVNQTEKIKDISPVDTGILPQFSISESSETDNFAFTFTGYIKIPEDGLYTFYLESNDGSVMYLDDFKLIDNDGAHGIYEKSTSTSLRAGFHSISVKYFQLGGGSLLNVSWEGPDIPKQEIPEELLFHENQDFHEAVSWLEKEADRIIRASKRTMNDGTSAFPPQVGLGYEAFWLRDYAYTLEGSVSSYSDKELIDACNLFIRSMRADGAGVDCIKFDGTPIYKPGFGTMGKNPVADGSQFTVAVAWHTYQKTKNIDILKAIVDSLIETMNAVPRNSNTHLVHILPGNEQERCPYGFTDTIGKQGDLLFCSLLYVQASQRLSGLLEVLGRTDEADNWRNESVIVAENIRKVFWDQKTGLFRAATLRCREHDIWGSAFAVYLGVADAEQSNSIATYFQQNYTRITQKGQVRHLPGGVYWEQASCKRDTYQNGAYWATPTGWFVYTLDIVNPGLARQTVIDMVNDFKKNGANEWKFGAKYQLPNYLASASLPLAGIRAMVVRRN